MKTYKARGIVLHTIKYGDSGMVAHVLTDTGGRIGYMVQGVRSKRGHGNKGALLQPMFVVEIEGMVPPRGELHRFRELRALVPLRSVPFDARKSSIALFMAEMLYRLVREVEPNSPLFDFVLGAVLALDGTTDSAAIANFHLWFMVGLSRYLGFFPGNEWTPGSWFDLREGLFTPYMPLHGMFFSRENSALLGVLMDVRAVEVALQPQKGPRLTYTEKFRAQHDQHTAAPRGGLTKVILTAGAVPRDTGQDHDPQWLPVRLAPADGECRPEPAEACAGYMGEGSALRLGRLRADESQDDSDITTRLAALRLNRTQRVEFLNSMLSYFGYHLDAVRDVRSVDILREVF